MIYAISGKYIGYGSVRKHPLYGGVDGVPKRAVRPTHAYGYPPAQLWLVLVCMNDSNLRVTVFQTCK